MNGEMHRSCSSKRVGKQQVQQVRILNEVCCDGARCYRASKAYQKAPALNWSLRLALRARRLLSKEVLQDTVQISPFLIYSGHDSRRDNSVIRSPTQANL